MIRRERVTLGLWAKVIAVDTEDDTVIVKVLTSRPEFASIKNYGYLIGQRITISVTDLVDNVA